MNSQTIVDRPITKDDVKMINDICAGRSLDFTTEFMQILPQLVLVAEQIGWIEGVKPEVEQGSYLSVNGAIRWYETDEPTVTGALVYMNHYNLNTEQMDDQHDPDHNVVRVGKDTFYTGWAILEAGNERHRPYFEFLRDYQVLAWKPLPTYPGK